MVQYCKQCGRCCERWGWGQTGTVDDLIPWIRGGRKDILVHVAVQLASGRWTRGDRIGEEDISSVTRVLYWQDLDGHHLRSCPFLERRIDGLAACAIHNVRPAVCREYSPWRCTDGDYLQVKCPACNEMTP